MQTTTEVSAVSVDFITYKKHRCFPITIQFLQISQNSIYLPLLINHSSLFIIYWYVHFNIICFLYSPQSFIFYILYFIFISITCIFIVNILMFIFYIYFTHLKAFFLKLVHWNAKSSHGQQPWRPVLGFYFLSITVFQFFVLMPFLGYRAEI